MLFFSFVDFLEINLDFLQKVNENKSIWGIIVVKSNSFVCFLEEIEDIKTPFEINWPLEQFIQTVKGQNNFW